MKRTAYLIGIIALQVILLLSIVGKYQYIAMTGKPITLKTAPIDPTDLFYGEYVTLRYEVNEIDRKHVNDQLTVDDHGKTVYVLLRQSEHPWYDPASVTLERPEPGGNEAVIKGVLQYLADDRIHVKYGWERYYVPENTGRAIEQQQSLLADLRVSDTGEAVLERIRW
ncbi:GDYXXLXY domain-containing protein [Brevibacillus migulae]|uniref:GDYXXLXY domain-containing protein n=1 Tax=Brevibacillus migulae TaxID=1644114 RepID=UPI00106EA0B2|nr:GDYXXLXY domain-containing protein [Brevibacillus migulae]